jgi:O-antigen/teichoic acid export membrane protein
MASVQVLAPFWSDPIVNDGLLSRTVHGLKWSYAGTIANMVLQIGVTATMSRLLPPAVFGVAAMGSAFLQFITYFSQMGIGQALIQKKDLTDTDVRCAFTLTASIGVLCAGLAWLIAPLAQHLLDSPEIVSVVRALAISFVVTNLSLTSVNLLRRRLAFGLVAIVDTVSYGIGAGLLGVVFAWRGLGVWAIVLSTLAQSIMAGVVSYALVRHNIQPCWNRLSYRHFLSYGGRLSGIGFLDYLAGSADLFVVGRFLGEVAAGIYSRSTLLVNLPIYHLGFSLNRVLFPVLSQVQDQSERRNRAYLVAATALSVLLFPIAAGVTVAAPQLVAVMLGAKWSEGIRILQVYAWVLPFGMIAAQAGIVLDAQAQLSGKLRARCIQLLLLGLLLAVAASWGAVGIALAALYGRIAEWYLYHRELKLACAVGWPQLFRPMAWGLGYAVAVAVAMVPVVLLGTGMPAVVLLLAEIGMAACSLLSLTILLPPPYLSGYLLTIMERRLTRDPSWILERWRRRLVAAAG